MDRQVMDDLLRRLENLEREVERLRAAAGIRPVRQPVANGSQSENIGTAIHQLHAMVTENTSGWVDGPLAHP
jgi:hypothetical protein